MPDLSASVDGYNIKLCNAITTVTAQRLAELCVDQANIDNQFCPGLTRAAGGNTPGRITNFTPIPQNVADFQTRRIGFNFNYRFILRDLGTFNLHAVGGYLDGLTFIGSPGATPTNERNQSITNNGGASNELDQQPDFASLFYPVSGIGRFIYAGAKVRNSRP